jgi:hypothetical protein
VKKYGLHSLDAARFGRNLPDKYGDQGEVPIAN